MKKIYLTLAFMVAVIAVKAQSQTINGDLSIGGDGTVLTGPGNRIYFNGASFNGDELSMYRFNRTANVSDLRVNIGDDYGSGDDRFLIGTTNWVDGKYYVHMVVGADGKVGIGTEVFGTERLAVNGNIRAREIKVEATGWPDYVFQKDYKISSLADLDRYIKLNKHLPGIPDAQEVKENGIELGEMNKLLLQKIEELTLHLIEKDKTIKGILKRMDEIEKKIKK
ncbi:hypothetical protein QF042_001887 [Pedobacter sp. W3I1]|uniref:hypothetical protein n=1 Tax=Pedobacter sp. W3I1 TaxID=3042291 RepID=UPI00278152E4|nr:hypothetical protein [Pedobacter sp. W3I1]MDQ0638322.1 hypothetical protein [Pedobacter sp. W3I1]